MPVFPPFDGGNGSAGLEDYSNLQTYALNALVIFDDIVYRNTTPITVFEAFDVTKWTRIAKITNGIVFPDESTQMAGALPNDFIGTFDNVEFIQSFSVDAEDTDPLGVFFKPDGLRMFVAGNENNKILVYDLVNPFDLSASNVTFNNAESKIIDEDAITGLWFTPDGLQMFVCDTALAHVSNYVLTEAWNPSTAPFEHTSEFAITQDGIPRTVQFNAQGTLMYVLGTVTTTVYVFNLTTPYDITTASISGVTLDVSQLDTDARGIFISGDGKKLYYTGSLVNEESVYAMTLPIPWDLESLDPDGDGIFPNQRYNLNQQFGNPTDIFLNQGLSKMFIVGDGSFNSVIEYDLGLKNLAPDPVTARHYTSQVQIEADFPDLIIDKDVTIFLDASMTIDKGFRIPFDVTVEFVATVNQITMAWAGTGSLFSSFAQTAIATANISGGGVTSYNLIDGGDGYLSAPIVTVVGGVEGTGATALTTISGGKVTSVNVLTEGIDFLSIPAVTIAPPEDIKANQLKLTNFDINGNGSNQLFDMDIDLSLVLEEINVTAFGSLGTIISQVTLMTNCSFVAYFQGFLFLDNELIDLVGLIFFQTDLVFPSGNPTGFRVFNPNNTPILKSFDATLRDDGATNPRDALVFLDPDANADSQFNISDSSVTPADTTNIFQKDPPLIIGLVANSGGDAVFDTTETNVLSNGQTVIISGYTVNTNYNGTFIVDGVVNGAFLTIPLVIFGSDEQGGIIENVPSPKTIPSVSNNGSGFARITTLPEHNLQVNDLVILFDFATETVYNGTFIVRATPTTTTFDIDIPFEGSDTGTLTVESIDSVNPLVTAKDNPAFPDSMNLAEFRTTSSIIVGGLVNVEVAVVGTVVNPLDWTADPSTERFSLNTTTGILTYIGINDITAKIEFKINATPTTGGAQTLRFRVFINGVVQLKTSITIVTTTPDGQYIGGFFDLSNGDTIQLFKTNQTNGSNTVVTVAPFLVSKVG